MRTMYSMTNEATEGYNTNFTWTSVGPADDGGTGPRAPPPTTTHLFLWGLRCVHTECAHARARVTMQWCPG